MAEENKKKVAAKARTSMIIAPHLASDIKFIGLFEHETMTSIIDRELTAFVSKWKSKHPDVKFPTTK